MNSEQVREMIDQTEANLKAIRKHIRNAHDLEKLDQESGLYRDVIDLTSDLRSLETMMWNFSLRYAWYEIRHPETSKERNT